MEKWESAARNFIDSCKFKADIECVFLTGSYAFGNADEFSDVDLFIVLNDDVNWRERGNKQMDGFLIEYFANPVRQVKKYIDDNYLNADLTEVNMILNGIIIFDKNSAADKMIDYCKQKSASDFPKMNAIDMQTGLYHLWDEFDELNRAYKNQSIDFSMHFFGFIRHAFNLYSRYVCSPIPNWSKMHRWLTDDNFFKKYGLMAHKDSDFIKMYKSAFGYNDTKTMMVFAENVYKYVTDKMGGFDINNFVLHGPCEDTNFII